MITKKRFLLLAAALGLIVLAKLFLVQDGSQKLLSDCNSPQGCERKFVIVLHGLVRSAASMNKISQTLNKSGYTVCNLQYPSRKYSVEKIAQDFVIPEIKQCLGNPQQPVNFVTHSMGGIVVRQIAQLNDLKINRVVMLSPPNQGSELVDKLRNIPGFKLINGEAGLSLGTNSNSVPNSLGTVPFEVGVITGNKSLNPFYSALIPGEDDGKVAVDSAKVAGMKDFLIVPHSHSLIMNNETVIEQTINFLDTGQFN